MKQRLLFVAVFLSLFFLFPSCEKEYSFENGGVAPIGSGGGYTGGTAQYTFNGGTSACSITGQTGTYIAGSATAGTHTVVLEVDVDSIGTYIVTTAVINGVKFTSSGTFTTTGIQEITLTASGIPTAAGTFDYIAGAAGCTFSITVEAPVNNTTGLFKAKIEGVQWVADKAASGARMNGIINLTGVGLDKKTITITMKDSGVHQYTLAWDNSSLGAGAFMDSNLANVTAFTSNAGSSPADCGGTVNITSIDEVNKKMSGTFSFKAIRQVTGETRTITEGVFTDLPYVTSVVTNNPTDTFTVKIDGTAFVPSAITGFSLTLPSNNITIQGSDATGVKTVAVLCPTDVTPGTYTIGSLLDPYYGQYNASSTSFLSSTTGSLEILFHDPATKRIRGRFSFSASDILGTATAQITEGYFAVTYN